MTNTSKQYDSLFCEQSLADIVRFSFGRRDSSIFVAYLFFISYLIILFKFGFFRDWQELITEPYFIVQGLKNYTDIATHHAPLLTELLAVIYRFMGTSVIVRMIFLLVVSIFTAFLTFRASYLLGGKRAGFYSLLLLSILWPFYGGTNFWFDTFLPLFYLFAFVVIVNKKALKYFFFAGISMGLSFLVKQTAGLVAVAICLVLLIRFKSFTSRLKEAFFFSLGVLLPIIFMSLWYGYTGQLDEAIYWMFEYNLSGDYVNLGTIRPPLTEILRIFYLIAPIVLFLVFSTFSKYNRHLLSYNILLVLAIGLCASFTIFPRWERWHVAPSVPFLVIALTYSFKSFFSKAPIAAIKHKSRPIKSLLVLWIFIVILDIGTAYPPMLIDSFMPNFASKWPLRSYDPPKWVDEKFKRYQKDVPAIGKYLHNMTPEGEKIFVWGWGGSRIYFESKRLPAGKFYYALPWFTYLPCFKADLISGFELDRPLFVVVLNRRYSGTPSLLDCGIDLEKLGYIRLNDLKNRFSEVDIWKHNNAK